MICSDLLNFHGTSRRRRAICLPPFERDGSRCFSREPSIAIPWRRDDWHVSHLSTGAARSRGEGGGGTWRKPPAVSGNLGTRGWGWDGGAPAVPLTSRCDLNSSRTTRTTLGPRWLLSVTVRMMAGLVFSSSNWILFFLLAPEKPQSSPGVRRASLLANKISLDWLERGETMGYRKYTSTPDWNLGTARLNCF